MKFLCDQCKAKYQISDDKVAGKTVRMKCRKCGHMIEVRASVTETSVAGNTSAAGTAGASQSDPPPAPGAPGKPAGPPTKPSGLPPKAPLATSLSQAGRPAPPRAPTPRPETGLAGAFKSSMQTAREDEAALLELSTADEWYAAINGVPVGPIRVAELRRKAALGAVTEDSLVWQEGMEEWRPVKTVAELASIMREAAANRGSSLGSPEPPNVRQSAIPPAPAAPSMRPPGGGGRPLPPRPASAAPPAPSRNNVVPITSRLATAERLDEPPTVIQTAAQVMAAAQPERFSVAPDPFALPPPAPVPAGNGAAASAAVMGGATPYRDSALPPPSAAATAAPVVVQKAPPNYIGIGMVGAFLAFGAVAAWALFIKPPAVAPPPQVIVQQMPMPQQSASPTAPSPSGAADTAIEIGGVTGKVASKGTGPAAAANVKDAGVGNDMAGLLKGLGTGPNVAGPSGGGGGGVSLTGEQIEPVVRSHSVGVKRTCVERGASTVSAINETVQLTIGGNGHVTNSVASGNDPITGNCLEKETRAWVFPASGATSTVNIPFHLVKQ